MPIRELLYQLGDLNSLMNVDFKTLPPPQVFPPPHSNPLINLGRRSLTKCSEQPQVLYASEDGFIQAFLVASKNLVPFPLVRFQFEAFDVTLFTDCLSDRELRRVAYKLNGEEWSQLGTFLGVGDKDLVQLGGLSMGPQEKAFRLLCVWRTRCRLGRAQMISQLAVSLEEVSRKDVAQFVLEQFMSGKPRKKFFGW